MRETALFLLGPTKTKILRLLKDSSANAIQVASALDIQVSAVRKHLLALEEAAMVVSDIRHGGPGRPKKMYSLTEVGREIFARSYDKILIGVVAELVQNRGPDDTENLFKQLAAHTTEFVSQKAKSSPIKLLNDLGFEAEIRRDNRGNLAVVSRNCPLLQAAQVHREILCRGLHEEILKLLFRGSRVKREKWILNGERACTHLIAR